MRRSAKLKPRALGHFCERLETRRLLAVVFKTDNTITTTDGGGPVIFHPHVEVIFWGSGWLSGTPTPSENALANMVSTVTSGPYLNDLSAYRAGMGSGILSNTVTYTGSDPPATCPSSTVFTLIRTLVNNGTVPRPNTDANLYYMIFPQSGTTGYTTSSDRPAGFHSYTTDNQSNTVHFGCTVNDTHMDTISTTYSHELAEAASDPEGNAITATVGGDSEVCDGTAQGYGARLGGYQVNSIWIGSRHQYVVPTGVQDVLFNFGSILITGDQLFGQDDVISLSTDPVTSGTILTFNGESVTFLNGTANNTPLSFQINTLAGNDTVNIGQVVSSIPITLDGGTGTNALNVTNTSFITSVYYNQVIGGGQAVESFTNFQSLHVTGSSAADEINTFGNHPGETWVIDGGGGNDIINITSDSNADTTVNGGDGNDTIDVKGAGNLIVNGGNGTDQLGDDPTYVGEIYSFFIGSTIIIRTDTLSGLSSGTVNYSNVESLLANGGTQDDTFAISSTPGPTTLNGNDGNDTFTFGNFLFPVPSSVIANLTMNGGNGLDTLSLDDEARTGGGTYSIGTGSLANATNVSGPGFTYLYSSFEGVQLTTGSGGDSITIGYCSGLTALTVNAGGGNDAVTYGSGSVIPNPSSVILDGGSGTNTATLNDNAFATTFNINFNITSSTVSESDPFGVGSFSYSDFTGLSVTGTGGPDVFNVSSTAAGCPVTVIGNGGADVFNVSSNAPALTGDLAGLAAALYISGGTGSAINVSELGQSAADDVTVNEASGLLFSNTLGWSIHIPGNANTAGIHFTAGSGGDTITVLSTFVGEPYTVNAGPGDDVINVQMPGLGGPLSIDGGDGYDRFSVTDPGNASATTAWAMNTFNVVRHRITPDQTTSFQYANTEVAAFTGTPGIDTYAIQAANPGEAIQLDGAGGNDVYTIGTGTTSQVQGNVQIYGGNGGNDLLVIDDSVDTTGRTVHIDDLTIGAGPGDNLFGGGGSVYFSDVFGSLSLLCGSGADTVSAVPNVFSAMTLQGNDPTTFPGDSLLLGLAAAQGTSFDAGSSTYSFSNRASLTYSGFESVTVDDVAPSVLAAAFNYDAAVPSITVQFSEDVSRLLSQNAIQLVNTTTNTTIDDANLAYVYDPGTNTATFTFPGLANQSLPDGNYTATLASNYVMDTAGNTMPASYSFNFFSLAGDANHDGVVDVTDLGALATNWQGSGVPFSGGDFNYDGVVDVSDLGILATNWQKSLLAPALARALKRGSSQLPAPTAQSAQITRSTTPLRPRRLAEDLLDNVADSNPLAM